MNKKEKNKRITKHKKNDERKNDMWKWDTDQI